MSAAPALEVKHLTMRFGGLVAINDLNFIAHQRDITAIIGPNCAGKTTVFRRRASSPSTASTGRCCSSRRTGS